MKEIWQQKQEELQNIRDCIPYFDNAKEKRYVEYKMLHYNCSWADVITYVNIGLDKEFYTNIENIADPGSSVVLVNKYRQLGSDYIPGDLEVIVPCFNAGGLMLRHDARQAFEFMCREAFEQGISLQAISTFRSFVYQNKVYFSKMSKELSLEEYQRERDKVSARPGHSEHQTGLAVDINDLEQTFESTPEGKWLAVNSHRYGFLLRYPKGKEWITGYDYEPWHFRYLGKDLAEAVYQSKLTYDEYWVRYLLDKNEI